MSIDLTPYQAVLLDLDGTIYHEDQPLPGAIELIRRLQAEGRKFACLSNSTTSPLRVMMRLADMGVEVDPNHIYTAAAAACDYIVQNFPREEESNPRPQPRIYNLASEAVDEMLQDLVQWVQTPDDACDAVIVGAAVDAFAASEQRQRTALDLVRGGAALVGISADRIYPSPRGAEFGAGALSWMLAYAAGIEPIFCGKPQSIFFAELCKRLDVNPEWCLLVGDNVESDVLGGKAQGMRTILVLSGVTRKQDLQALPADAQPDLVVQNLHELL